MSVTLPASPPAHPVKLKKTIICINWILRALEKNAKYYPPCPCPVPTCHSKLCLPISAFILALKKATGSLTCQRNTLTPSLASSCETDNCGSDTKPGSLASGRALGKSVITGYFEFHNFLSILWLCWSFPECINPYCEGDQSTYV